jgi:hypothetical protein
MGVELVGPYSCKKRDPAPKRSALLSRFRYRIATVFQPTHRALLCKGGFGRATRGTWGKQAAWKSPLTHTVALLLNHRRGNPPLQLAKLLR